MIDTKIKELHLNRSEFIRHCIKTTISGQNQNGNNNSQIDEQMSLIFKGLNTLKKQFKYREQDTQNIANRKQTIDLPIEEQILLHLGEKHYFLDNIASCCTESPAKVREILEKMRKDGLVAQTKKKRWYKL